MSTLERGYGGIAPAPFQPLVKQGFAVERRRTIAKLVSAFAFSAVVVCVVFSSSSSPALPQLTASSPPSRMTSLMQAPEMVLASKAAGFDLTMLLQKERTTELENSVSNTGLCRKRDKIIQLFNDLLKRLVGEASAQTTYYTTLETATADAKTSFDDAEAASELAKKTHGDAERMKNLALTEAATAITAFGAAKDTYALNRAPFDAELTSIDDDIALIKELLQMIKVLHAEPGPTAATKAEQHARLAANVLKIQKLALRIKSPTAQALSSKLGGGFQSLAEYDESNAVVKILMDLLQDILNRQAFIQNELVEFKNEMDDAEEFKEKKEGAVVLAADTVQTALTDMNQYTTKMMSQLAADAASAKIAQDLQQTLVDKAGVQFTREKYVIGQIMLKINAYCNEMEDTSVDIAHMSCPFPDAMLRLDDICTCKGGFSGPDVTGPCETCADDEYCFSTGKGKCVENAELVHDHSKCICSVGYSGTDNAGPCTKCEEGHMCPGGDFEPDQCPTGKIPNADHTECVIKPGFYADAEDTSELAALSCTAGKVCVGGAGGAAAQCLADSEPNEDQTACVCNPGYSGADNAACAACPSGSICAGGAAAPVACGANSDPSGDKSECECKAGFYGPNGGTCATCPNGYLCLGGTNADSCPNMARAINGGRGCECVNGAVGDGRTCHNCPANHICAGGNSPARLCTGDGRTPVHRHAGMRCGCLGYWKGADTDANGGGPDCLRKTFGELIAGGITIPPCSFDGGSKYVILDTGTADRHPHYSHPEQQKFNAGKWHVEGGVCTNRGVGTTGKGAEVCKIHGCKFSHDTLSRAYFKHGARAMFYDNDWWNGQQSEWKSGGDWWPMHQCKSQHCYRKYRHFLDWTGYEHCDCTESWNDKVNSFIVE